MPRTRIYVSFSGRKGYHIEVFFDRVVDGSKLFNLYSNVIKNGELDPDKVEFRPTPNMAIKLPLSIHGSTGNVCWFVDRDTLDPILDEAYILSIQQVCVEDVVHALSLPESEIERKKRCTAQRKRIDATEKSEDADNGITLTEQGKRHNTMRRIAVYHRTNGYSREDTQTILEKWYAKQPQELIHSSPEEVQQDIASILDWAYSDRFIVPGNEKKGAAFVSESQLMIALNQSSRSARRITFLLLMRARMNENRISADDIGKTTGISSKTVYEVLHRLVSDGIIKMEKGRRLQLPDRSFAAQSNKYTVPHKEKRPYEMILEVSMRELSCCFDRTYHLALHTLVPQSKLREILSVPEWKEYLSWAEAFEEDDALPKERRIDLLGTPYALLMPLKLAHPVMAYQVNGRWLFPAYDMALILGYANPSVIGSQCQHKELWQIQVNRRRLPNGVVSHQVLNKNFIPLHDVFDLVERSSIPEKEAIREYLKTLAPLDDPSDKQGVIAS